MSQMMYDDFGNAVYVSTLYSNDEDNHSTTEKPVDIGENVIRFQGNKITVFTSIKYIRDAVNGLYYQRQGKFRTADGMYYKVGSLSEDLFFKVTIATGECKSPNLSNTLFFLSPQQYSQHMGVEVSDDIVQSFDKRHERTMQRIEAREKEAESKRKQTNKIEVIQEYSVFQQPQQVE